MATGDQRLREYADDLVTRCPDLCPTVNQLYSNMLYLRSVINQRKMDYTLPCKAAEPDGCCLTAELTVWNEFLWPIDMEIRETRPGRFALCRLLSRIVPIASGMQRRHAGVLIHWLLTRHRCVEFVEICQSRIPRRHFLFCDGLRLSHGIRHVKFCYYGLDEYSPRDLIASLTSTVATLNTLEIVSVRISSVSLSMLCDFLGRCKVLSTLVFLENWLDPPNAEALAKSMAGCGSLEKVHLDELFLADDTCRALGCLVSSSANLRELIVSKSLLPDETGSLYSFGPLFRALSEPGTQLERMTIRSFVLDQSDLDVLSASLRVNGQVKCLRLLCSGASEGVCFSLDQVIMHNSSITDICVKDSLVNKRALRGLAIAIRANATLEQLVFDDARTTADEAMVLIDALTMNTTLQKCHLGKIRQPGLLQFLKTIRSKDLIARLDFTVDYTTTVDFIGTSRSIYKMASVCFEPVDIIKPPELQRLSKAFCCSTSSLTSLTVRLPAIDCNLALTLSTVLSSCRHLRKACLEFPAEAYQVVELMEGLGKSRRLDELTIRGWTFVYPGAGAFSRMLRATRSLTNVTFEALTQESSYCLMMELRRGLLSNYTLLKAKVYEHPEEEKSIFEIHEYLRRNQSLLIQASRFIVPPASSAKNAAAAFEKVRDSRALVAEVSRLAGLTMEEAAELVTCRRRHLDINYLAIAGVVKEKVECHRTEADSAVQIDQLTLDCWLHIRRYLVVEDILDDVGTPTARSVRRKLKIGS